MANKPLQSIKFPGLSDTYIVPQIDNTLTQSGQAADAKVVGDKLPQIGIVAPVWEFGRFNTETGEKIDETTRIRTKYPIPVNAINDLTVYCSAGFQVVIYELTSGGYQGTRQTVSAGVNIVTLGNNTTSINLVLATDPAGDDITLNDGTTKMHIYINGGAVYDLDNAKFISVTGMFDVKTLPVGHWCFTLFSNIKASLTGWPVSILDSTYIRVEKKSVSKINENYVLDFATAGRRFSCFVFAAGSTIWYLYNDTSNIQNPVKAAIDELVIQNGDSFENFEIGAFDTTRSDITSTTRVRTEYKHLTNDYCIVSFAKELDIRICRFTSIAPLRGGEWINEWGENNNNIIVKGGGYFRALIRRYKNDISHVMDATDVTFIENNVSITLCDAAFKKETVIEDAFVTQLDTNWRIGTLDESGKNLASQTRIRTSSFIPIPDDGLSYSIAVDSNLFEFRVAVYESDSVESFIGYTSPWTKESANVSSGSYIRVIMKYADGRSIDTNILNEMVPHIGFGVKWTKYENHYNWLKGKTVAIFGDSISTTGYGYKNETSQVPEIIIGDEDVGEELKVYLTYRDFHPYKGNGVQPEDTSAQKPVDGITAHDLILGGITYSYEFTPTSQGGDGIPYVNYTINGVSHKDVLGQQEYTFIPTASDVGKHFGQADNHNQNHALPNWWQLAQKSLGFKPLNACFSGSCVSRARNLGDDIGAREQQHGSHAWNLGQIRRCGRRIPGTMQRESPDVIIVYRGTNDYGSPQNGKHPRVNTDILDTNQNLETYFEQYKDLVGVVRANGEIVQRDASPETGDRELYGFTEAYLLTVIRLQKAYPFAKIFLCTLNDIKRERTINNSYPYRNDAGTLQQWNQVIRKVAEYTGCGLIDFARGGFNFFNCQTFYPENKNSGVHPYSDGQVVMANHAIADLKAQYSPMFNEWNCIKDLLNDTSIEACDDDEGFPTSDSQGAWEYVQGKIKNRCIWDGETTIG